MTLQEEIIRRKTFGIIAHPDAGKTTLTEKLLLFGGAIQTAGAAFTTPERHCQHGGFVTPRTAKPLEMGFGGSTWRSAMGGNVQRIDPA